MQAILTIGLTLIAFYSIIIIMNKKRKKSFNKVLYRQSDMHNILKNFFFKDIFDDKVITSQSKIWKEKQTTRVVIIDQRAYWVSNNMFYVGDTVDGKVRPETGKPLDTTKMSKREVDKMLFILDNLKNGKINDSGSAGNQ
jgi:archaellin